MSSTIHLIIKGNQDQALAAARTRGIVIDSAHTNPRHANETNARCSNGYRNLVVSWFAELPRVSPYPVGTLLLFTEGK